MSNRPFQPQYTSRNCAKAGAMIVVRSSAVSLVSSEEMTSYIFSSRLVQENMPTENNTPASNLFIFVIFIIRSLKIYIHANGIGSYSREFVAIVDALHPDVVPGDLGINSFVAGDRRQVGPGNIDPQPAHELHLRNIHVV